MFYNCVRILKIEKSVNLQNRWLHGVQAGSDQIDRLENKINIQMYVIKNTK